MTAKEYLHQAYKLNEVIKDKQDRLEDLRIMSTSIRAVDYSKEKVQGSASVKAPFADDVIKIIELENELKQDINRLKSLKVEINYAIEKINDVDCVLLLSKRYIFLKTWEQIAAEMNYSITQIHRIHSRALHLFEIPKS